MLLSKTQPTSALLHLQPGHTKRYGGPSTGWDPSATVSVPCVWSEELHWGQEKHDLAHLSRSQPQPTRKDSPVLVRTNICARHIEQAIRAVVARHLAGNTFVASDAIAFLAKVQVGQR